MTSMEEGRTNRMEEPPPIMEEEEDCCKSGSCKDSAPVHPTKHLHVTTPNFLPDELLSPHASFAVLHENGVSLDVFDSTGKPRTFALPSKSKSKSSITKDDKLCFSTHGLGNGADGLLTPCFDENGEHGDPEEGCFCGVDTPHLHAHLHDPRRCATKWEEEKSDVSLTFLAKLTLHPVDEGHDEWAESKLEEQVGVSSNDDDNGDDDTYLKLPISAKLPKQCNSMELRKKLSDHGLDESSLETRRMIKVQHEDHFDYLVHNRTTGELNLEHPCDSCGSNDYHGKFRLVGKRQWTNDPNFNAHPKSKSPPPQERVLQFFEIASQPFHVFDVLSEFISVDTPGRVAAVRNLPCCNRSARNIPCDCVVKVEDKKSCKLNLVQEKRSGRCRKKNKKAVSTTSSAAAPAVASIPETNLDSVKSSSHHHHRSIEKDHPSSHHHHHHSSETDHLLSNCQTMSYDAPKTEKVHSTKHDHHDHFSSSNKAQVISKSHHKSTSCCSGGGCSKPKNIPTPDCSSSKIDNRFPVQNEISYFDYDDDDEMEEKKESASLLNDASYVDYTLLSGNTTARSQFFVKKICCASEIAPITKIVEPQMGVKQVNVNATVKMVYVDHDPSIISATQIKDALDDGNFEALIKKDGGADALRNANQVVAGIGRSKFFVEKICCSSEVPVITNCLQSMEGVSDISIDVITKSVYVHHDLSCVSATEVAKQMKDIGFSARIKYDAGQTLAMQSISHSSTFVMSEIQVKSTYSVSNEIEERLKVFPYEHIKSYVTNAMSRIVTVEHNPYFVSAKMIKSTLEEEQDGFCCEVVKDGGADGMWALQLSEPEADEVIEEHDATLNPYIALSGVFWLISMLSVIGDNWGYFQYVGIVSVAFGLPGIAVKAVKTMCRYQFDSNCMMFTAVVGAFVLGAFTEAAAVAFLFSISEWLESKATTRARNALSAIVSLRPDRANLINPITQEIVVVPAGSVGIGAIVSVRTGDKIPCDGIVIEGQSTVDESSLTGESRPVKKGPNNVVSGGTINSGTTQLVVKVTATVDNSAVGRLIRLVEEAQANRSKTEKIVDEFAKRYTPIVLLSAICMCTIPWAWGYEVGRKWTMNGLMTIIIACPCALIISTPVTYVAGLAATAQRGIVVKGGAHLESLGLVEKIAFDKTGTLTEGVFKLLHLTIVGNNLSRKEVLEYLSVMEAKASHPLADALVNAAKNEGVPMPAHLLAKNHTFLAGEGVTAEVNGSTVYVGNTRLFKRLGLYDELDESLKTVVNEWSTAGGTVGFISVGSAGIVGAYSAADAVRKESRSVVSSLEELGIKVSMLTGDASEAAHSIGYQVGLSTEQVHSQLLPEDKLILIESMQDDFEKNTASKLGACLNKSLVLMCGDGVNDAPALAMADVGVAMGAGAALAMETSDLTLMDSNLEKLVYCIKMGRCVGRTITENIVFSLVAKVATLALILAGRGTLWFAIVSDVGAMLIVTLNGMKLLPSKKNVNDMYETLEESLLV